MSLEALSDGEQEKKKVQVGLDIPRKTRKWLRVGLTFTGTLDVRGGVPVGQGFLVEVPLSISVERDTVQFT